MIFQNSAGRCSPRCTEDRRNAHAVETRCRVRPICAPPIGSAANTVPEIGTALTIQPSIEIRSARLTTVCTTRFAG